MTTLKLTNFQQKYNLAQLENEVLKYWDETKIFEKSIESRPANKRYVFYDGPPFATGLPHYGHILTSVIKDAIPRYWTMKGYRVDRVWGWDCHGIPIENMIEKELGLAGGKKGIEEMGTHKFNAACRAAILRFDKEWEGIIRRIGRWVDFKNSYKTMDRSYMESVWWAFKKLYEKDLVYEGKRVILYCPRCATPLSNFEIAMDNSYKDLPGPSTTYKYKLVGQPFDSAQGKPSTYLLAWSTTPWNKLATPALAVNPAFDYVKVNQNNEYYILAENTTKILNGKFEVVEKIKGKDLEKFQFEMHYKFYPPQAGEKTGVIVADPYVTDVEGTGVVTLAVYGEDDWRIMTKHNVQLIYHVDDEGKLKDEVVPWQGMFMLKVNPLVNEDLQKRNLIYHDEQRLHSVPVCYRCETRLYHAPIPAWFINIQKMKPALLAQNENINWYPSYLKHGRFGKGLETAPDWNISRSRYWGTPMPIWKCQPFDSAQGKYIKEQIRIIGSLEELKKWAVNPKQVEQLTDIHREYLDDLEVWVDDAKTIKGKRIPEVFDCWVESGSMPYASIHYPFEHKELFESTHPAQFIVEYISQTRAWFYTLHVMSVGLFDKHTFENALTHGVIQAEDGAKMSKSKKNYPDPTLLFEKYGVDALRFYLMGSVVMKAENVNFSEAQVKELYQKIVQLLWNTFSFYKLYATGEVRQNLPELDHDLDRWIVSKTNSLIKHSTRDMDHYDTIAYCRNIQDFVDELSTWYLRRSRERFKEDPGAMDVFGWVLKQLVLVMAPVTPFIAELIYQNLVGDESIHLQTWPNFDESKIDLQLEKEMELARKIVAQVHASRKLKNKPIRIPLKELVYDVPQQLRSTIEQIMVEETNVKTIKYLNSGSKLETPIVTLDYSSSRELELEGSARELIRKIQQLRKEKACKISEKIKIQLPKEFAKLPPNLLEDVKRKTLVESVVWGDELIILNG